MSPDVLLECPRTSFRDVLRVNVTERVWHSPLTYLRRRGDWLVENKKALAPDFPPQSVFGEILSFFIATRSPSCWTQFLGAINLAFYFPLNIETFCSGPDLYFAKPGGCEHLKTIYWWNLLLLSGIAGHYFKTLSSMFSCKTHSAPLIS